MFDFKMPPFSYILFNDSQIMYIPDEYTHDPEWDNLKARFSGTTSRVIEVTDKDDNPLFIIGNPEIFMPMIRSEEHFLGWDNNGTLNNRKIHMDITNLIVD